MDVKYYQMEAVQKADVYYPEDKVGKAPKSLNEKTFWDDFMGESLPSALTGHTGAYYTTVRGQSSGNDYTAHVIVSPPNWERMQTVSGSLLSFLLMGGVLNSSSMDEQLPFDDNNLDFFLVSNELYTYNEIDDYSYSEEGGNIELYSQYMTNSLGYATYSITEETDGKLHSIIPICVDGVPSYIFSEIDGAFNGAMYKPLVVSQERYDELEENGLTTGQLSIIIQHPDAADTKGIATLELSEAETMLEYQAKVPLASRLGGFEYPISQILLYPYKDSQQIGSPIEIDNSQYILDSGNLYFITPIHKLLEININPSHEYHYKLEIKIHKIIPDTTEDTSRLALIQTTSHMCMDYFNLYTYAAQTAYMVSEVEYTRDITLVSTMISTPLVFLGSYLTSSATKMYTEASAIAGKEVAKTALNTMMTDQVRKLTTSQIVKQLLTQMAIRTVVGSISEVLQEVILDGIIETLVTGAVKYFKGSQEAAYWISTLVTSARESKFFGYLSSETGLQTQQQSLSYNAQIFLAQKASKEFKTWYGSLLLKSEYSKMSEADILLKAKDSILSKISDLKLFGKEPEVPKIKKLGALSIISGLLLFMPSLTFLGSGLALEYTASNLLQGLDMRLMHTYNIRLHNKMVKEYDTSTFERPSITPTTTTLIEGDVSEKIEVLPTIGGMPETEEQHKPSVFDRVNSRLSLPYKLRSVARKIGDMFRAPSTISEYAKNIKERIISSDSSQMKLDILGNEKSFDEEVIESSERIKIPIVKASESTEAVEAVDPIFKWKDQVIAFMFYPEDRKISNLEAFMLIKEFLGISKDQPVYLRFYEQDILSIEANYLKYIDSEGVIHHYDLDGDFSQLLDELGYRERIDSISIQDWIDGKALENIDLQIEVLDTEEYIGSTGLSQEAQEFYVDKFGYWLKERFDVLITEHNVQMYEELFQLIKKLDKSLTLTIAPIKNDKEISNMNKQDLIKYIDNIGYLMESYWNNYFTSEATFQNEIISNNYKSFVQNLYNNIFKEVLEKAKSDISALSDDEIAKLGDDPKSFMNIVKDRLQFTILNDIMRECGIDDPTMSIGDINQKLREFLQDKDRITQFEQDFHTSEGIVKFLQVFAECFLTDPLMNRLIINRRMDNYFGYTNEKNYIFTVLKSKIIDWFNEIVDKLTPEQLEKITVYDNVKYNPNDKVINPFDLVYTIIDKNNKKIPLINFYSTTGAQKTGRFFDGGGIFDFGAFVVSTHLKSTWYESIVKYDGKTNTVSLVNSMCSDGISAMIVDVVKRLSTGQDIKNLPDRIVQLIAPFIVQDLDETIVNVEKILETFYSKDIFHLDHKLADHEVFLVALIDLINIELKQNIKYSGMNTNKRGLREAIGSMMQDPVFQEKVQKKASSSFNSQFYPNKLKKKENFIELANFLINPDNFEKLTITSSSETFQLQLRMDYNPHFLDKNNEMISLSDFPAQYQIYRLDHRFVDDMQPITSDQELLTMASRGGLVVCHHDKYLDNRIILVPGEHIHELSDTQIREGFKDANSIVHHNIFVANKEGIKLISELEYSENTLSIRERNWANEFYQYSEIRNENQQIIRYESNFYAAYLFATGYDIKMTLQPTSLMLEHIEPYKSPLPLIQFTKDRLTEKELPYKVPEFIAFNQLDDEVKNELGEIISVIDQLSIVYLPRGYIKYKYESVSQLIVSENFFEKDLNVIKAILIDFNPSMDELADLSQSHQKLFYHTFNELIKKYNGENYLLKEYQEAHSGLTFSYTSSYSYTSEEFEAVRQMEEILPEVFGYRFYSLLKIGMISLSMEENQVKFTPLVFHYTMLDDILNMKRVQPINTLYKDRFTSFDNPNRFKDRIFIPLLVFGHLTTLDVKDLGAQTIYTKSQDIFLKELTNGKYEHPIRQSRFARDYGSLARIFISKYMDKGFSTSYLETKNIIGKTSIMNSFKDLLEFLLKPEMMRSAGGLLEIDTLKDNPKIWSKKYINYAFTTTFQRLVRPGDPTRNKDFVSFLTHLFTGDYKTDSYLLIDQNLRGISNSFWDQRNYGTLTLDYNAFIQYFGANLHEIQPAFYYNYKKFLRYGQQLNVESILSREFIGKITHLFNNFYDILSNNYGNGQKLTAEFHIENHLGFNDESRINSMTNEKIIEEFKDLIDGYTLEFTLNKYDNKILNDNEFQTFIASIVFYMVMFNAQVFIKEGDMNSNGNYGLFASQRELYFNDYIIGIGKGALDIRSSEIGNQIYNEWNSKWNLEGNELVWDYSDCWPLYLLNDARSMITWFKNNFIEGQMELLKLDKS